MSVKRVSRRDFLKLAAIGVVGAGLAACAPAATEAPPAVEPTAEEEEVEPSPMPKFRGGQVV